MSSEEEIAIKIGKTLSDLCPSFIRDRDKGAIEWHKCNCKINNDPCSCVWHITDTCVAGTWVKLSFINDYKDKKEVSQNKMLSEVRKVINNSNTKKQGIESRFDLMDLGETE